MAPLPVLVLAAAALGGAALQLGRRRVGISATQKGQRVREGGSPLIIHPPSISILFPLSAKQEGVGWYYLCDGHKISGSLDPLVNFKHLY